MNNNFETMMEQMMEQMMVKMMEKTMTKMFSSMMEPEVANAEVTEAPKPKKAVQTLSKEDFLALSEEFEEISNEPIDFVVFGSKTARYNHSIPSDIWTVNHIAITQTYGAKWSKKNGGYIFNTPAELRNFLQSYQIKTELTDNDKHNIKLYKQERAKARAEYYANLANNK